MSTEVQPAHQQAYQALFAAYRGDIIESLHYGAVAVVKSDGELCAWAGDPQAVTFMRSSAKPFQTIPLVEKGGLEKFQITAPELAITCASHSGTDRHLKNICTLQRKIGLSEADLSCCTHAPLDKASRKKLQDQGLSPSQNHHNCSGKHTGMLAQAALLGASKVEYTETDHPVQREILGTFCEMCDLPQGQVIVGRDGCSVPTFAVPLYHAALAWARLMDPSGLPNQRADACRRITAAMLRHPFQVAGPGRFDTRLMEAASGKVVSKTGAEAYQTVGIYPGVISPEYPALGIALKIADGDRTNRSRGAVTLEILRQLGALTEEELDRLRDLGPTQAIRNQCGIVTGEGKPCFQLQYP